MLSVSICDRSSPCSTYSTSMATSSSDGASSRKFEDAPRPGSLPKMPPLPDRGLRALIADSIKGLIVSKTRTSRPEGGTQRSRSPSRREGGRAFLRSARRRLRLGVLFRHAADGRISALRSGLAGRVCSRAHGRGRGLPARLPPLRSASHAGRKGDVEGEALAICGGEAAL